jgi:hypothetical protein
MIAACAFRNLLPQFTTMQPDRRAFGAHTAHHDAPVVVGIVESPA